VKFLFDNVSNSSPPPGASPPTGAFHFIAPSGKLKFGTCPAKDVAARPSVSQTNHFRRVSKLH